jgi:hypothetical protein
LGIETFKNIALTLPSLRKEEHVKMVWASIIPFINGWAQPVTSEG